MIMQNKNKERSSDLMVSVRNLHKSFGELEVLKGINMDVRRSQVIGIIGPSGSGKSTLLRLSMGLIAPDSGKIRSPSCMTGDLPSGWMARNSGGARFVLGSRLYFSSRYSIPNSSSSHRMRCERELFK